MTVVARDFYVRDGGCADDREFVVAGNHLGKLVTIGGRARTVAAVVEREAIAPGVAEGKGGLDVEIRGIALDALQRGFTEKRPLQDLRDDIFYPVRRYLRTTTGRSLGVLPTVLEGLELLDARRGGRGTRFLARRA